MHQDSLLRSATETLEAQVAKADALNSAELYYALGTEAALQARGGMGLQAIATLSAVIMAMLIKDTGLNVFIGMAIAILVGIACGLVNGFVITDFDGAVVGGTDLVQLEVAGPGGFWIGDAAFDATSPQARFDEATERVQVDSDGDGSTNFTIRLNGITEVGRSKPPARLR